MNEQDAVRVHVYILTVSVGEGLAVVVRATDARTTAARLRVILAVRTPEPVGDCRYIPRCFVL